MRESIHKYFQVGYYPLDVLPEQKCCRSGKESCC